jgi:mercuric ion transport protein
MSELNQPSTKTGFWLLLAGTITALGASACCVIPITLLALGIGSASFSFLSFFEPYRFVFIGATLLLPTFAFHRIYFAPRACPTGSSCTRPKRIERQRIAFWVVSLLVFGLIAFPWIISLFDA